MSCIRSCYDKDSSNFGHDDCPTCIHKDATPQRTWVGLTDEDKMAFLAQDFGGNRLDAMDWAEERLKEKNNVSQ